MHGALPTRQCFPGGLSDGAQALALKLRHLLWDGRQELEQRLGIEILVDEHPAAEGLAAYGNQLAVFALEIDEAALVRHLLGPPCGRRAMGARL